MLDIVARRSGGEFAGVPVHRGGVSKGWVVRPPGLYSANEHLTQPIARFAYCRVNCSVARPGVSAESWPQLVRESAGRPGRCAPPTRTSSAPARSSSDSPARAAHRKPRRPRPRSGLRPRTWAGICERVRRAGSWPHWGTRRTPSSPPSWTSAAPCRCSGTAPTRVLPDQRVTGDFSLVEDRAAKSSWLNGVPWSPRRCPSVRCRTRLAAYCDRRPRRIRVAIVVKSAGNWVAWLLFKA